MTSRTLYLVHVLVPDGYIMIIIFFPFFTFLFEDLE